MMKPLSMPRKRNQEATAPTNHLVDEYGVRRIIRNFTPSYASLRSPVPQNLFPYWLRRSIRDQMVHHHVHRCRIPCAAPNSLPRALAQHHFIHFFSCSILSSFSSSPLSPSCITPSIHTYFPLSCDICTRACLLPPFLSGLQP